MRKGSLHLGGGLVESGHCILMAKGRMQRRQSQALFSGSHGQENGDKLKPNRFI